MVISAVSDAGPDRGVAVREAARAGASGRVVSVHRKAVYLALDGALIAIVSAGVERGPLHLRSGPLPRAVAGEQVRCDGSRITALAWAVRCDVPVWEGALPAGWQAETHAGAAGRAQLPDGPGGAPTETGPRTGGARPDGRDGPTRDRTCSSPSRDPSRDPSRAVVGPAGSTGLGGQDAAPTCSPGTAIPADVPVDPERLGAAVRAGAVEELARLLGGLGPGLTPAGDDLLAGLLLAARASWGAAAEARLVAAAGGVRTTAPAQAFLYWAARGQSLAPAHDVLAAHAAGDAAAAERAGRRLSAIGASSGRCLLAGVRTGVAQLPRLDTQSARAGAGAALWTRAR